MYQCILGYSNRLASLITFFISSETKWRWWDSNSWPPACKAGALPTELHPRFSISILNVLFVSFFKYWCYQLIYIMKCSRIFFFLIWQPPTFPCRLQHSIIGRSSLNRRVRDVYGCFPRTHRHQKSFLVILDNQTVKQPLLFLLERRWSSRTFRYGYLVTTSPQSSAPPSAAPSFRLGHWLRAYPTPMVWRAVCTRPGNVFTATFWFAITSDSSFM